MTFRVFYELAQPTYDFTEPACVLIAVFVVLLEIFYGIMRVTDDVYYYVDNKRILDKIKQKRAMRGIVFFSAFLSATTLFFYENGIVQYFHQKNFMKNFDKEKSITTEGVISNFHEERGGRAQNFVPEGFTVSGTIFTYSQWSPGFHQIVESGSPLRNGLVVRITHIGNDITKLEIDQ